MSKKRETITLIFSGKRFNKSGLNRRECVDNVESLKRPI